MIEITKTIEELTKDVEKLYNKPGKGKKEQEYLKHGAIALGMNKAFGPIGWDCVTEKVEILKPAYRCNSASKEDPAGAYWSAIASATVTVRARSLFRPDGSFVEVTRTSSGVGQAVGSKSPTEYDAIQGAITSAETQAFKRACRYFGPSTGLTLTFEVGEREAILRQIEQANQAEKIEDSGPGVIEGEPEISDDLTPPSQLSDQAPVPSAQAPAMQAIAEHAGTNGNGTHGVPEVLKNLGDQDVLNRIAALESDDATVPVADVKALQLTLIASFEKSGGIGVWKTAGLPLNPKEAVTRRCLSSISQVLEEASIGAGGLDGFLAKFKTPPVGTPEKPGDLPGTSTMIMNGKHVAGPAPTAAPVEATVSTPAVEAKAPVTETKAPAKEYIPTHGEQMQQAWDESEMGKSDLRERYQKRFGSSAQEVIKILTETPHDAEVAKEVAGKIHVFGITRYHKLNQPANVFELWRQAGYEFGQGQPTGRHLRAFADALPD